MTNGQDEPGGGRTRDDVSPSTTEGTAGAGECDLTRTGAADELAEDADASSASDGAAHTSAASTGSGSASRASAATSSTTPRTFAAALAAARRPGADDKRAYRAARLVAVRAWAIVGCAAVFVIAFAALGRVGSALECLFVALLVGFICSPITNWLERRGVSRALGAFVALLIVIAALCGLLFWLGPLFFDQLRQLLAGIPSFFNQVQASVRDLWLAYGTEGTVDIQTSMQDLLQSLSNVGIKMAGDLASTLSNGLFPNVMNLANSFVMFFLGLVMAYWFAKDYPTIMRELGVIAGPRHDDDLSLLVAVLSRSVGGYMRGIVITSVLNGVLAFVGFLVVGNPYAGLMGIIVAILHFVPVVGPALSAVLATLVGLFASPAVAFWTLVWSIVAQNVTDNLVGPLVMQSAVKIHPAMSLIGITVGASLGGAFGMALAVPLTAAIKGVFVYYFENKTGRQLVSYDGAFFRGTPFHHPDGSPVPSFDALDDDKFLAQTRLVTYDEVDGVEADERPEDGPHMFRRG